MHEDENIHGQTYHRDFIKVEEYYTASHVQVVMVHVPPLCQKIK